MRLPVLALLLAAACGSGVCAGCGGDDGGDPIPAHFRVTSEPLDFQCDGSPGAVRVTIANADTDAPTFEDGPAGWSGCEPAIDDGDHWTVRCYSESFPTSAYFEVTLAKSLDGGSVTRSYLDCTVTGLAASVEML